MTKEEMKKEVKFKYDGQWYYRGNKSDSWFFLADRSDGSPCGIAERVPKKMWPILEKLAEIEFKTKVE